MTTIVGPRPLSAYNYLITRGLPAIHAAAAVGDAMIEDYDDLRVAAVGDLSTAHGVFQWHSPRWDTYLAFAASQGREPDDLLTQFAFFLHELDTTERPAGLALADAKTLEEAMDAMVMFERPRGYPPARNVPSWPLRLAKAQAVLSAASPK